MLTYIQRSSGYEEHTCACGDTVTIHVAHGQWDGQCCACKAKEAQEERELEQKWATPSVPVPQVPEIRNSALSAMRTAFEFGYRCAEKGMNLQRALGEFDKCMNG